MASDEQPPPFRVVATNKPHEIARARAKEGLIGPLRELTANLMRITRGAGKPIELFHQVIRVAELMIDLHNGPGPGLSEFEIHEMLSGAVRDFRGIRTRDPIGRGDEIILSGALQVVASQLLDQITIARKGESEIRQGMAMIEDQRARNRAELKAAEKAYRQSLAKTVGKKAVRRKKRTVRGDVTPPPPDEF